MKLEGRMPVNYGICLYEVGLIIDLYVQYQDWAKVKEEVMHDNLMQRRKLTTCEKMLRELRDRMRELSLEEMKLYQTANATEKIALIWIALCRHYPLLTEFWVNVILPKFESSNKTFKSIEVVWFVEEAHSLLKRATFSDASRVKMGQTMIRIFREAGMLIHGDTVTPLILSRGFIQKLSQLNPDSVQMLPIDPRTL